jgi:hypothetical protein
MQQPLSCQLVRLLLLPLVCMCAQVKLVSARGLCLEGVVERLAGLQARLLLPNRRPVLSGVVQLQRRDQQEVTWEHDEQFTEVGAVSSHTLLALPCDTVLQPPMQHA